MSRLQRTCLFIYQNSVSWGNEVKGPRASRYSKVLPIGRTRSSMSLRTLEDTRQTGRSLTGSP